MWIFLSPSIILGFLSIFWIFCFWISQYLLSIYIITKCVTIIMYEFTLIYYSSVCVFDHFQFYKDILKATPCITCKFNFSLLYFILALLYPRLNCKNSDVRRSVNAALCSGLDRKRRRRAACLLTQQLRERRMGKGEWDCVCEDEAARENMKTSGYF